MKYLKNNGGWGQYPHSFNADDFKRLEKFLSVYTTWPLRKASVHTRKDVIGIRHDVDHNIEYALKFAQWEHQRGIHSTYFVLHTAWYYSDKEMLYRCIDEIVDLGHEVGLHHNTLGQLFHEGRITPVDGTAMPAGFCVEAAELMNDLLAELRAHWEIVGCAAHGVGIDGISNLDLWAAGYTPQDFDLEYEAYHLHRHAYYVSDNHGKWQNENGNEGWEVFDTWPLDKQMHVSMHPCHWEIP